MKNNISKINSNFNTISLSDFENIINNINNDKISKSTKFLLKEILLPNIGDIIVDSFNKFFQRKTGKKTQSPLLGECIDISEQICIKLREIDNKNIISIKLKQGLVKDVNKMDNEGYRVSNDTWDDKKSTWIEKMTTYTQHTIVGIDFLYNGEIESVNIDLTANQFELKEKTNEYYKKEIELGNIEVLGEIINMGDIDSGNIKFILIPDEEYIINDLFDRGYNPKVIYHESNFIKKLQSKFGIDSENYILTNDDINNGYDYNLLEKIPVGNIFYILENNKDRTFNLKCFKNGDNEDEIDNEDEDDLEYSKIERDISNYYEIVEKSIMNIKI